MTTLLPYQTEGVAFLAARKRALLADDMGLGKTIQAIYAARAIGAKTVRVLCPASLVGQWQSEFARHAPAIEVAVVSYDRAVKQKPVNWPPDVLILDESHYCKSPSAKRAKTGLMRLGAKAPVTWCLTGTPMPNNPAELWTTLRALAPERIIGRNGKPATYHAFVSRFCITKNNGFGTVIVGGRNHEKLREILDGFMLRRVKSDVLTELPPIRFVDLALSETKLELPPGEEEALTRALDEHGVEGLSKVAEHVATLRRVTGMAKAPAVAKWIRTFLTSTDRKLVVFAHHKEVLRQLRSGLGAVSCYVGGDTPSARRKEQVDLFQKSAGHRVFFGQIQAAGTGLTLTAASDMMFIESSWVPAENQQAAMRIHRIGQNRGCVVRFAHVPNSIDERIQKAVRRKTADIEKVLS